MADLVVTVPKWFWPEWIVEGDPAGTPELATSEEWGFFLGGTKPDIGPGDRLYIVAHDLVRGFAPVTRLARSGDRWVICRRAGAEAVTIPETVKGFRGWRRRWWKREDEVAFPDWKTRGVPEKQQRLLEPLFRAERFTTP